MRLLTGFVLSIALAGTAFAQEDGCAYDAQVFAVQGYETFNTTADGWQALAINDCYVEAAEAISGWHRTHAATLTAEQLRTLTWNAGLMRGAGGDYQSAIFLFRQTFPERGENAAQHYYTYAMIAFLERDRDGLQRIRDALASMPAPEGGLPDGAEWPPNLQSVDNLVTCFDSPFGWAIVGYCGDEVEAAE
ncbi:MULTISPECIES: hypothetical protein [Hyphobacterium]|uniref:Tetratricopeptide repeat protein n=1 Tax=Hyphobacterium vulgare TaxID=1736751 RepID=A0ABV6ZTS6_9PROT